MIRCARATVARAGRIVVEDVSFGVSPGQAAALIGRSGAGKSSLLAAAAGAVPLHGGDILIDGRSVRREADAVRRAIGYVPSRLPTWEGMRAAEFLELFAAAGGLAGWQLATVVDKAVDMAGLKGCRSVPLTALPDGHAKRLLIARALLHDPQVLLLDDPFGGLDPLERGEVERVVGDAHLMGRTVLAAIDDAAVPGCFTQLSILAEGRLIGSGPATPAGFAGGRRWRHAIVCRGAAEAAAKLLAPTVTDVRATDADTVECTVAAEGAGFSAAVAMLVRAGIAIESAGFHPPWTAQLLGE